MNCIACEGTGQASKGGPCKPCQGSGQIEMRPDLVPYAVMVNTRAMQAQANTAKQLLPMLPCETEEDFGRVNQALRLIKHQAKELDTKRRKVTKPLNDAKREVDSWFKPVLDLYKEVETTLKDKLKVYQRKQEEQRRALLPAIQQAHQQQDFTQALALSNQMAQAQPAEVKGTTFKKVWVFKVTDPNQIPRQFMQPNETLIRAYMRDAVKAGETPTLPGVEFWQDQQVSVR